MPGKRFRSLLYNSGNAILCTAKVSSIIAANGSKEEIEKAAKEQGTKLLRDNASELVQAGETSIDELVRTTFTV